MVRKEGNAYEYEVSTNKSALGRLALPKPQHPFHANKLIRRTLSSSPRWRQQPIVDSKGMEIEVRDPNDPVAQDYLFYHHQRSLTQHIGSNVGPHYKPHELLSEPPSPKDVTLELLMASQAHIGHATSLWNPANAKYIFGVRGVQDPIHIISLDVTAAYLRRACKIVRGVTSRGGLVLFVGTREGQARTIVKAARMAKGCHLFTKWIPGSITNGQQILGQCRKKIVDEEDREILGFQDQLQLSSALKPDLVVCLNPLENYILLHECGLHNIPTIGIIDTDANPTWVTYPIPANDDSLRCVQVICGVLGRAGEEGQRMRLSKARQGIISSLPSHGLGPPTEGQEEKEKELRQQEMLAEQAQYEELGDIVEGGLALPDAEGDVEHLQIQAGTSAADDALYDNAELDSSLGQDFEQQQQYASDREDSYVRDRPLSQEELAQAPPTVQDHFDEESLELEEAERAFERESRDR